MQFGSSAFGTETFASSGEKTILSYIFSTAISVSSSIQKQGSKLFTSVLNITPVKRATIARTLSTSLSITSELSKSIQKVLLLTATLVTSITKVLTKSLSTTINLSTSISTHFVKLIKLVAELALSASIRNDIQIGIKKAISVIPSRKVHIQKSPFLSEATLFVSKETAIQKFIRNTASIIPVIKPVHINKVIRSTVNITSIIKKRLNWALSTLIELSSIIGITTGDTFKSFSTFYLNSKGVLAGSLPFIIKTSITTFNILKAKLTLPNRY